MTGNMEKATVTTGLEKVSFHSNPKEGQCQRIFKLPHNCTHFTCYQSNRENSPSQASTLCKLRTSKCSSWIYKTEEPEIKLPASVGSLKNQECSRKNIYFCFIDYAKAFVWITTNCGKFLKRWGYHTTLLVSCETCMQVKKQQLEPDMEQ